MLLFAGTTAMARREERVDLVVDRKKIVEIVRHCLTHRGYSENEADTFIAQLGNVTITDVKAAETERKRDGTFWGYTDFWGAEGPDCSLAPG